MDVRTFNEVVEQQISRSKDVLISKQAEYAQGGDRLHNFKAAAAMQGVSLQEALGGMMIKHTVSVYDMINSSKEYPIEVWNEKITDHVNYLLLLRAILTEEGVGMGETLATPKDVHDFQSNIQFRLPGELTADEQPSPA